MRLLTNEERMALTPIGPPGEGPVSDATFDELERLGYGRRVWSDDGRQWVWDVTPEGVAALERDTLARSQ